MNFITRVLPAMLIAALMQCANLQAAPSEEEVTWITDQNGCKVANTYPRPGETITWSGECKDGYATGQGVLQWFLHGREDDRFEGNLEKGWAEGRGILQKADGGKYEGDWKQSIQEGKGRFEMPNGTFYDGEWKNGKPHGQGQYRRPDGKVFIGEWVDGVYVPDLQREQQEAEPAEENRI